MPKVVRVSGVGWTGDDNSEFQALCPICNLAVFLFKDDISVNCPVCRALVEFAIMPAKDNSH